MFWRKRKPAAISKQSRLALERLQERAMMAVIPLASGQTAVFHDGDGTEVKVKLSGPGQGSIELVGGVLTGAAIDTLSLTGTTSATKLKISTRGGSILGTTVNDVVIDNALGAFGALKHFKGNKVTLTGDFTADGSIDDFCVRSLGNGANVNVTGDVGRFKAENLASNAQLDVSGTLREFVAKLLAAGATVEANQLDMLKVKQQAVGADFNIGAGGLARAKIGWIYNSSIAAVGNVGEIVIKGDAMGTGFASNIDKGADGAYGTMDDSIVDANAQGLIGTIKFRGALGAAGTSQAVWIVTSGSVGDVVISGQAQRQGNTPAIWNNAANEFVALQILQDTANVPTDRTATGYDDSEIFISVYGLQINPKITPPPFSTYYLDPTKLSRTIPVAQNTQPLVQDPSTDPVLLPSFTLDQWKNTTGQKLWGSNLAFPAPPPGMEWSGRILISVGAPVQAQINNSDGTISAPSPADLTDPSTGTFYDFLEFTVTNPNSPIKNVGPHYQALSIDIDTSMVDAFGLPMRLQLFQDASGTTPYNLSQYTIGTHTHQFSGTLTNHGYTIENVKHLSDLVNHHGLGTGQPITTTTVGAIQTGTTITHIDVINKKISLSQPAQFSGDVDLTAHLAGPVGVKTTSQDILRNLSADSFVHFLQGKLSSAPQAVQPFLQSAAAYPMSAAIAITTGATPTQGSNIVIVGSTANLKTGDVVRVSGVTADPGANGLFTVTVIDGTSFSLDATSSNGAAVANGTWTAYTSGGRLVSPKDVVEALTNPADPNGLNNYFNSTIDEFFVHYAAAGVNGSAGNQTFSVQSTSYDSTVRTYSGQVELDSTYNAYALTLNETTGTDTTTYKIYYPFFQNNLPTGYTPQLPIATTTPPWISAKQWDFQSPSQMIFACDAVFADNDPRKAYDMNPSIAPQGASVLGDLENSISAAFNRGIALNPGTDWDETHQWFPSGGAYNYWVEYWHKHVDTYNDLAYAFPYDDKFGASTNLNLSGVGLTQILLGSWSGTAAATKTELTIAHSTLPATGTLNLSAKVTGTNPHGTVTFFINGVAVNPNDSTAPPLAPVSINSHGIASISAPVPALPSGTGAATYTVTAVYSGDDSNLPSIASSPVSLVEVVNVALTNQTGVLGSTAVITTTTPGSIHTGTMTYTISKSDGSNPQTLAANVPVTLQPNVNSYPIPTNIVTFTGNANGTTTISGITNMTDLLVGQVISGAGVPTGTKITAVGSNSITLDNTVATGSSVLFTSNGAGANLPITVTFTPSGSQTPSASGSANLGVTAAPYNLQLSPANGLPGATTDVTVTLPGPPYNGTIQLQVARPDGTDVRNLGPPITVDSSVLTQGNQVVVDNLTMPEDWVVFTAYADGTSVITGMSTVSGLTSPAHPTHRQTVTGSNVPSGTKVISFAPASLVLTNPANAGASTSQLTPETLTVSNGVTITGFFDPNLTNFNVTSVDGWDHSMNLDGLSITGANIGTGNTIDTYTAGHITLTNAIPASASQITFSSNGIHQAFPITAVWTPAGATPITSNPVNYAVNQ